MLLLTHSQVHTHIHTHTIAASACIVRIFIHLADSLWHVVFYYRLRLPTLLSYKSFIPHLLSRIISTLYLCHFSPISHSHAHTQAELPPLAITFICSLFQFLLYLMSCPPFHPSTRTFFNFFIDFTLLHLSSFLYWLYFIFKVLLSIFLSSTSSLHIIV